MEVKKMIFGEKIPDKDDPGYKEKHEKTVEAGKNFAKAVKLDKVAMKVQGFASGHPKLFLAFIFGFVLFSIGLNLYRMSTLLAISNSLPVPLSDKKRSCISTGIM